MADTELERRAERVFEETLDAPTADRPAAIAAACGADAALLARVRALSEAHQADGFLANPTVDVSPVPAADPVAERLGTIVGGRYKLLQQIGEGGFGAVFMAEQQVPVRRTVAVKVIKLGMDTKEVVARFEAERQALALMDHPNIAKVLDAGSTDAARPYFVMELVRGVPITDYADKHKLSTADRVALLGQVCRAVQHAHAKGVIHRDLKPTNVLVGTGDGDKPVPKVIDFGIAKATQSKLTDRTLFTQFRQLIGTPQYMSPEQADSEGVDVDTRSDVYSLGVLLYELLVGVTPLDARQLRSAAFEAMRKMIRDGDVPRPSTRLHTMAVDTVTTLATNRSTNAKHLGQVVRGELDWIVMRALEKDRSRRYDTAAALADDLGRYLAGDAVLAGPVSGAYRLRKVLRRHRAAVAVGSAVAACLLLGVTGTTWGLVQARHQRAAAVANAAQAVAAERRATDQAAVAQAEKRAAVTQKAVADAKAAEATATLDFLTKDVLAKASPDRTRDANVSKVLVDALILPALKTVDQRFQGQPLVRARVQAALAVTLLDLGRPDLADPPAKAAWDAFQRARGDDDPDTLAALNIYGAVVDALGDHAAAERLLKSCWDAYRRLSGDDDPDTLAALDNYAKAINAQDRHAEAEVLLKREWDACRRTLGDDHPGTLTALDNYAMAIDAQDRHAEAEPLFKQCWDACRRVDGEDHPGTLSVLNNYAAAVCHQGRYAEAERLYKTAWDACRRVLGDDHPEALCALNNYADAVYAQGHLAEAASLLKLGWDATRRLSGDDAPDTLMMLHGYALAIDGQGHHADAEPLFKQLWVGVRHAMGDDHPHTLSSLHSYAEAIDGQGRHADAEVLLRQAVDAYRRAAPDDGERGHTLYDLVRALAAQRKWPAAEAVAREELEWSRSHDLPDPRMGTVSRSLNQLNQCLKAQGKPPEPAAAATRP